MSWIPGVATSGFGLDHLPYGVFSRDGDEPRVGVRIGDHVLDLAGVLFEPPATSLNPLLAAGPAEWARVRSAVTEVLTTPSLRGAATAHLHPLSAVRLHLPFEVADYVDFYASLDHATNLGRILRAGSVPLPPNWRHLPVGYHGRAGTVVVSDTPVVRPSGQRPTFGPSERLDFEAELGFVVGTPAGESFEQRVFGVVLVNDWSARDIQAFEYVPLGPFLGKSFATSIAAWVTPLAALAHARVPGRAQDPEPLPYLARSADWGLDLALTVELNGTPISRPSYRDMYWTPDQMLAHLTVNGSPLRTGDLFASGTVSGPGPDQRGSLIELSWNGAEPVRLPSGETRAFLADGDTVTIRATAGPVTLGEVSGRIVGGRIVGG